MIPDACIWCMMNVTEMWCNGFEIAINVSLVLMVLGMGLAMCVWLRLRVLWLCAMVDDCGVRCGCAVW